MMIDLDAILRERGAVAHGEPLWAGPDALPKMLTVATDADWLECCYRAQHRVSIGAGRLEHGWTWEEGLARWAAWYLRLATPHEEAMGRTADEEAWAEQRPRWLELLLSVAELGSTHVDLVRDEYGLPAEVATGTVLTAAGRVPLADVPRSPSLGST